LIYKLDLKPALGAVSDPTVACPARDEMRGPTDRVMLKKARP
jgi:hypothetical protein